MIEFPREREFAFFDPKTGKLTDKGMWEDIEDDDEWASRIRKGDIPSVEEAEAYVKKLIDGQT